MSTGAAGAASAAAAIIQATRASGVIVRIEPNDFERIVHDNEEPLVVHATGGFFSVVHMYLTSYRGMAFFTKSGMPLSFSADCQLVEAQKIWIPG
jgi:hypothetical protein